MKALLIIDMQQGIFGPNDISIPNAPTIVHNTNILIEKAIRTNTPTIVVHTTPVKETYLSLVPKIGKRTHS